MHWFVYCLGLRPEKLAVFDEDCWTLMQECWEGDPMRRPLLGNVEKRLQDLLSTYKKTQASKARTSQSKPLSRKIPSSGSRTQFVSWSSVCFVWKVGQVLIIIFFFAWGKACVVCSVLLFIPLNWVNPWVPLCCCLFLIDHRHTLVVHACLYFF